MAFVVEDGSIVAGANSYVSVAEADAIIGARIDDVSDWTALDQAGKEKYLAFATQFLDDRVRWLGDKKSDQQELRWPRERVFDKDGFYVSSAVVPSAIRRATANLAFIFLGNAPASGVGDVAGLKRFRIEPIELEFEKGGATQAEIPAEVRKLLVGFGVMRTASYGVGRVSRS